MTVLFSRSLSFGITKGMISCLWYNDDVDLKEEMIGTNADFVLYFRIYIHCDDVFQ
jgi:hypothetical protein